MRVKLAGTAGFCMGVRRAMEMVLAEANKNQGPIYTYGPLIHNKQVLELLEKKGVTTVEDLTGYQAGTLVIRAHGIPPDQRKTIKATGLRLIDATCPRVARVQALIRYHTKKGYTAVIVGEKDHAEVIGLMGYSNGKAFVINHVSEVASLPKNEKLCMVAQTTQDEQNYLKIVTALKRDFPDALVFETICDATRNRQEEVRSFAGQVDAMVVVGGYHSGNTRRLVQVSEAAGLPTFHVETENELEKEKLAAMEVVGVTAGTSTPNWMIKNVVKEIMSIRSRRESFLGRWALKVFKFFLLSNLVVAFGAFSLTYAVALLSGREPDLFHPLLALLYIYAMHVLNRFLDKGASTYNDPDMANFYRRHKFLLILAGVCSMVTALSLSAYLGLNIFLGMAGLSILGILYSLPIMPLSLRHLGYTKIKDIPSSKTLSVALAWSAVIVLLPLLEPIKQTWVSAIISFLFVFFMVYIRSALFDIFEVQGDLIVGVETLPITLGERRTLLLLKGLVLVTAVIFLAAALLRIVDPFAYLLLLCPLSWMLTILAYEKRWLYTGTRLEALVEGNLFFAGFLGLIWYLLS